MNNPTDRFLDAVRTAGFADTDVFAEHAVSDTTPPNWRLQVHGAAAMRAQYATWFDHPAELADVRHTPLPDGELLEYTRSWSEDGVRHKGHPPPHRRRRSDRGGRPLVRRPVAAAAPGPDHRRWPPCVAPSPPGAEHPPEGGPMPVPRIIAAAVQGTPVFLDQAATIDKVAQLTRQAAENHAGLVVFPEAFVPGYPDWVWRTLPWSDRAWYARLYDQAVDVPGPATEALGAAARKASAHLAIGVNERAGGTLYNTLLYFAPDGSLLGAHRKLMATGAERLVWGHGDGSGLEVFDTPFGRLGGLICWENYMPLARAMLYAQEIDVYLAPTWDNSDVWVSTLRHIAKEGRVFVLGVTSCIRGSDIPRDLPRADEIYGDDAWLARGNTTICGPHGEILAGPLHGAEGIIYAEIDAGEARRVRRHFDPVGHYSRSDILRLVVDREPKPAVTFVDWLPEPRPRPADSSE